MSQNQKSGSQNTDNQKQQNNSSWKMPGLFAGLGFGGGAQPQPAPQKPVETAQTVNAFSFMNQQSNSNISKTGKADNQLVNNSQNLNQQNIPLSIPQINTNSTFTSQIQSQNQALTGDSGLGLFSGLVQQQNQSQIQQNVSQSTNFLQNEVQPSSFNFIASGVQTVTPIPVQKSQMTKNINIDDDEDDISEQKRTSSFGFFAGLDQMQGSMNSNKKIFNLEPKIEISASQNVNDDNRNPKFEVNAQESQNVTPMQVEISIIDNTKSDNSKNQNSFEEINFGSQSQIPENQLNQGLFLGLSAHQDRQIASQNEIIQSDLQQLSNNDENFMSIFQQNDGNEKTYQIQEINQNTQNESNNQIYQSNSNVQIQEKESLQNSSMFAFLNLKKEQVSIDMNQQLENQFKIPIFQEQHIQPSDPQNQIIDYQSNNFVPQVISNEDLLNNDNHSQKNENDNDNFEEILESSEMIEEKIFKIKSRMIDFTIKQQDIQKKIEEINSDISILEQKNSQTQNEQSYAIEKEDFEQADSLDIKIKQTKKLIEQKQNQIKVLQENNNGQELMKADKLQELSHLIHRSIGKLDAIREKQKNKMEEFEEQQTQILEQQRKKLHIEKIRLSEDIKKYNESKQLVDSEIEKIDALVYEDTKDQHFEKRLLDEKIEYINEEINEMERILERKKKEKEMLELEKNVHEKQIQQAKLKYNEQFEKLQKQQNKINQKISENQKDNTEYLIEKEKIDLEEIEYNRKVEWFNNELSKLKDMEKNLSKQCSQIDFVNEQRKQFTLQQKEIDQKENDLDQQYKQSLQSKEFLQDRVVKLELELEEFQIELEQIEGKTTKLETEKKKFASQKKFKEAGKCVQDIKDLAQRQEFLVGQLEKTKEHKQQIEQDMNNFTEKINLIKDQLLQVKEEKQKCMQVIFQFRKEEIIDLILSIDKQLKANEIKVQNREIILDDDSNEIVLKKDKLQNELDKIEDQLFQLEKLYGPLKNQNNQNISIIIIEEKQQENHNTIDQFEQQQEIQQSLPNIQNNEQQMLNQNNFQQYSKEALLSQIESYEQNVQNLEKRIEEAAEKEDYDLAEDLQAELDLYQNQEKMNYESAKQQIIQMALSSIENTNDNIITSEEIEKSIQEFDQMMQEKSNNIKDYDNIAFEDKKNLTDENSQDDSNELSQNQQSSVFNFISQQVDQIQNEKHDQNLEDLKVEQNQANENTDIEQSNIKDQIVICLESQNQNSHEQQAENIVEQPDPILLEKNLPSDLQSEEQDILDNKKDANLQEDIQINDIQQQKQSAFSFLQIQNSNENIVEDQSTIQKNQQTEIEEQNQEKSENQEANLKTEVKSGFSFI